MAADGTWCVTMNNGKITEVQMMDNERQPLLTLFQPLLSIEHVPPNHNRVTILYKLQMSP